MAVVSFGATKSRDLNPNGFHTQWKALTFETTPPSELSSCR